MLLVTKTHHERDETKGPDKVSLQDIGQVEISHSVTVLNVEVVSRNSYMHVATCFHCKTLDRLQSAIV